MTGTELPTGDELVPHLDSYDDDLLTAYVRGLLEHFEMQPASLDPYDGTRLSDFADAMTQDLLVAANGGNVSPLIQFAYRGVLDVARDAWLEARESSIETNDSDDIGDAILFALGAGLNADQAAREAEAPAEPRRRRLYGLLRRFRACGQVIASPSERRLVRPPGFGVESLERVECPELRRRKRVKLAAWKGLFRRPLEWVAEGRPQLADEHRVPGSSHSRYAWRPLGRYEYLDDQFVDAEGNEVRLVSIVLTDDDQAPRAGVRKGCGGEAGECESHSLGSWLRWLRAHKPYVCSWRHVAAHDGLGDIGAEQLDSRSIEERRDHGAPPGDRLDG